ncbi:MAG: carboxymuconolactone decarboxylase family protein [Calditrichia bacterium]
MMKHKRNLLIVIVAVAILSLTFAVALSQSQSTIKTKQRTDDNTYPELRAKVLDYMAKFETTHPAVINGFSSLYHAAVEPGALDIKTKELIALGIAVSKRCDGCIAYHTHASLKAGATEQEIMEVLGVAVYMGGGPSLAYATHVIEAMEQFKTTEKTIPASEGMNR